ncbi:Multicopper oxidase [Halogranum amylolyticum]|uniref:Multicopper oxidase n=1 Tax=Halogranum amylolyticum TaxID=660520 RepID=A0A1H8VJN8_9EURY|nr:hypothetical protein [Halogranum amylolyticum]SEP15652.1 Multicopper oxidase [Halogranum amylolyticum]
MSGDTFHGSAVTTYTDGRAMLKPINKHVAPDVYVPGNWDYSNEAAEDGNFVELMNDLDAMVLANNLYDWETDERLYDAYRILEVGSLSVGVVGMTNVYVDRMAPSFYEGKYRFSKHPALLEESAQAAREDGADVVVAVTEIGLPWMVQAAKDCASVDVMFSAHTHEYTYDPIVVKETETVVVESGMGEALGRVDLRVQDGELQFRHHLYCLTENGEHTPEPDADAAETVESVRAPFFEGLLINGRLPEDLPRFEVAEGERVRLRFVNAGSATVFGVRIAGDEMTVTHADGRPVEPVDVDSFVFEAGERYDAVIEATNPGTWAVQADALDGNEPPATAIVEYESTSGGSP